MAAVSEKGLLSWTEYLTEAAKKYSNYSCVYISPVAVASPCLFLAASSSLVKAMFSLLRGFL